MCPNSQNEEYAERLKMESDTGERVIFLSTPGPGVCVCVCGGGDSHIKVTGMLAISLRPKLQFLV